MPRERAHHNSAADHIAAEVVGPHGEVTVALIPKCSAEKARMLLECPAAAAPAGRPLGGLLQEFGRPQPGPLFADCSQPGLQRAFARLEQEVPYLSGPSLDAAMQNAASFGSPSVRNAEALFGSVNILSAFAIGNVMGLVRDAGAIDDLVCVVEKSGNTYLAYQAARALVAIGGTEVEDVLQELVDRTPPSDFKHDIGRSVLALLRTPLLFTVSSFSFDDQLVREVFAPWDELVRLNPATLMSLAQPLEFLLEAGVLGRDRVTQTVWRVARAERYRMFEALETSGGVQ
jgi:hypothetical protein